MRRVITVLISLAWVLGVATSAPADYKPPNILFIISDDHGWPFYSFTNDIDDVEDDVENAAGDLANLSNLGRHEAIQIPALPGQPAGEASKLTPTLDRLAQRGVVFPRGHAADSYCVPSFQATQSALNGKDSGEIGSSAGIDPPEGWIGDYLSRVGYRTFAFGKSWNGFNRLGFDCATDSNAAVPCSTDWTDGRTTIDPVIEFLDDADNDPNTPWFLFFSQRLPHGPHDGRLRVDSTCYLSADPNDPNGPPVCPNACGAADGEKTSKKKRLELPPLDPNGVWKEGTTTITDVCERFEDLHDRQEALDCFADDSCGAAYSDKDFDFLRENRKKGRKYMETIMLGDFFMGLMLEYLRAKSLLNDDLLIVYQTDNGYFAGSTMHKLDDDVGSPTENKRRRATGWKKSSRENGFRTPFFLSWPGGGSYDSAETTALVADRVKPGLVHAVDIIPTLLHAATDTKVRACGDGETPVPPRWDPNVPGWIEAADPNAASPDPCLEGKSMLDYLGSNDPNDPRPDPVDRGVLVMQKGSKTFAVTHDGYRLFRKGCDKFFLYDLNTDPDERTNLYDDKDPNSVPIGTACFDLLKHRIDCWRGTGCITDACTLPTPPASCEEYDD